MGLKAFVGGRLLRTSGPIFVETHDCSIPQSSGRPLWEKSAGGHCAAAQTTAWKGQAAATGGHRAILTTPLARDRSMGPWVK